jgi:hypothetical protein
MSQRQPYSKRTFLDLNISVDEYIQLKRKENGLDIDEKDNNLSILKYDDDDDDNDSSTERKSNNDINKQIFKRQQAFRDSTLNTISRRL